MDFFGLLKEIVGMVVIANAVTDHKDSSMTEDYAKVLETLLRQGDDS